MQGGVPGGRLTIWAGATCMPKLRAQEAGPRLSFVGAITGHVTTATTIKAPHARLFIVRVKIPASKIQALNCVFTAQVWKVYLPVVGSLGTRHRLHGW